LEKKLIGLILVASLAAVFIAGYGNSIYSQPNQTESPDTCNSTSQVAPTQPNETSTESSNKTSNVVPNSFTPAVPEFTVELIDTSYDVPATYSTDPYTGKQVTHEGYHVARRTIEVRIKNQPFTPYTDRNGWEIKFYYNVRIKGHYTEWGSKFDNVYKPEEMPTQSNSEYTIISFHDIGDGGFYLAPAPRMLEVSPDGQIDVQVKALVGFPSEGDVLAGVPSLFTGTESDWSATQTLRIP